ncbi:DUF6607 family protein [Gilvimarinus polysaccharolyticus]|uniref:DUF6607 family protein n=1 Tax=Gilvimarinus polysaccharolyticus TaxID=863921 RepID=UPI00067355A2|nr:DUF6607 family protein [Gilvimarinus polysaccharolyticus]
MKYIFSAFFIFNLSAYIAEASSASDSEQKSSSMYRSTPQISKEQVNCKSLNQWTFSWPVNEGCNPTRGGTTQGPQVVKTTSPDPRWRELQKPGLSSIERDRRAILAMAGDFKTTFEFIEVLGFTPGYKPAKPYQSWATEYVYVITDEPKFISLQHIMVMYFVNNTGEIQGPMVMKHWRQDWQYEQTSLLEYQGDRHWKLVDYPANTVQGQWAQTVYQVDDTPRYASFGNWQHSEDFSRWQGGTAWRPLPRREHSVRDDYQILEGSNTQTITATGWVHEQENQKRISSDQTTSAHYQAKELGFNRYRRIKDFDFSAGDDYWKNTADYWALVRNTLNEMVKINGGIKLKSHIDGQPLFMPLFDYAQTLNKGDVLIKEKAQDFARETLEKYSHN